jgi:hypothetical protein
MNETVCPLPAEPAVAVILRGSAFRSGGHSSSGCNDRARDEQYRATSSLLKHVVLPLETVCGARVDIFVSSSTKHADQLEKCAAMSHELYSMMGTRLVALDTCVSAGQDVSMRAALDLFKCRHRGSPSEYTLIVVARHDYIFSQSATQWEAWRNASLSRFNFISRCEHNSIHDLDPPKCVSDLLHTMPGRFFGAFDHSVGKLGCFHGFGGSGHRSCGFEIPKWIERTTHASSDETWGFLTGWLPKKNVQELSPIGGLYDSHSRVRGVS